MGSDIPVVVQAGQDLLALDKGQLLYSVGTAKCS